MTNSLQKSPVRGDFQRPGQRQVNRSEGRKTGSETRPGNVNHSPAGKHQRSGTIRCVKTFGVGSTNAEPQVSTCFSVLGIEVVILIKDRFVTPEHRHAVRQVGTAEQGSGSQKKMVHLDAFGKGISCT